MHDYLREINLNPIINGGPAPITDPNDPRALHYFGFLADGQEIVEVPPFGTPTRILISWHYANNPVPPPSPAQPPPPVDAVLDLGFGPPVVRYDTHHQRRHAIVWLDPSSATSTAPIVVRVRAWATE